MVKAATRFGLLAAFLLPGLAWAEDYTPPDGCQLEMTVQLAACKVAQYYRCEGDDPGDQWVAYFTESGGPTYISRIDDETRWMESHDVINARRDFLGAEDAPASLSNLLATGRDDFDFWIEGDDGLSLHYQGFDRLTGEEVVIDGQQLLVTEFDISATDGEGNWILSGKGNQFVSKSLRRFYSGSEVWSYWDGESVRVEEAPRQFLLPGQRGFGSLTPQYGCQMQVAGVVAP